MRVLVYDYGWPELMRSFAEGIVRYGHEVHMRDATRYSGYEPCDVAVTIEWPDTVAEIHRAVRSQGGITIGVHDGYLRRRGENRYYGVARNGVHNYGEHVPLDYPTEDRWERLGIQMKPWRTSGTHILIAHQWGANSPSFKRLKVERQPWIARMVELLPTLTDRLIVFRTHPNDLPNAVDLYKERFRDLDRGQIRYIHGASEPFAKSLENCHAVVAFDSGALIDAALAGVPVFVGGISMADPVANHDIRRIEDPIMPDRQRWANWLAWAQWQQKEMRAGLPWKYLIETWGTLQ